jgi:hypothetical protein
MIVLFIFAGIGIVFLMMLEAKTKPRELCKLHTWVLNGQSGKTFCSVCNFVIGESNE